MSEAHLTVMWSGDDWEDHIHMLLSRHYPVGDYQRVPSRHGGDFGIDGFSRDGKAYQCYAPEKFLGEKDLYERQRDKITDDLTKFCANSKALREMLGKLQIGRWLLVVPDHGSAQLLKHAASKTVDVRRQSLDYVADDFEVGVITDRIFETEKRLLALLGVYEIGVTPVPIDDGRLEEWAESETGLMANLRRKAQWLTTLPSESARNEFVQRMARNYLEGQSILGRLHDEYPEIAQRVAECKAAREQLLSVRCVVGSSNRDILGDELKGLKTDLENSIRGVSAVTLSSLVLEALADWLMRCPLEFTQSA